MVIWAFYYFYLFQPQAFVIFYQLSICFYLSKVCAKIFALLFIPASNYSLIYLNLLQIWLSWHSFQICWAYSFLFLFTYSTQFFFLFPRSFWEVTCFPGHLYYSQYLFLSSIFYFCYYLYFVNQLLQYFYHSSLSSVYFFHFSYLLLGSFLPTSASQSIFISPFRVPTAFIFLTLISSFTFISAHFSSFPLLRVFSYIFVNLVPSFLSLSFSLFLKCYQTSYLLAKAVSLTVYP